MRKKPLTYEHRTVNSDTKNTIKPTSVIIKAELLPLLNYSLSSLFNWQNLECWFLCKLWDKLCACVCVCAKATSLISNWASVRRVEWQRSSILTNALPFICSINPWKQTHSGVSGTSWCVFVKHFSGMLGLAIKMKQFSLQKKNCAKTMRC